MVAEFLFSPHSQLTLNKLTFHPLLSTAHHPCNKVFSINSENRVTLNEFLMSCRTFPKDRPHLLAAPKGRAGGDITTHERTAMKRWSSAACSEMTEWALSEDSLLITDKDLLMKSH